MGTITYQSVSDLNPSLDDIFAASRRQIGLGPNSYRQEVVDGPWAGCQISYSGQNFKNNPEDTFPSGSAMVQVVTIYWQGKTLFSLNTSFVWLADIAFKPGIVAVENLLWGATYGGANTFNGSGGADRLTTYRAGDTLNAGGGDDRLWGRVSGTILNGQAGNDTFVATASGLSVNGSTDAELGQTEIDSLEIHGLDLSFAAITNIDVLRFVDNGGFINRSIVVRADQIGDGLLSRTLHVESAAGIANRITVERPAGGDAVQIDLSGWTFDAGWAGSAFRVELVFNEGITPLDDTVTGTVKNDLIRLGNGANVLRGGLGADRLYTGNGADLFIYGSGEATAGEIVDGGEGIDTIEVRGDNDFSAMTIHGIERLRFAGVAKVTLDAALTPAEIAGDDHINSLAFVFAEAGKLDLSLWTFSDWSAADNLEIKGSSGNDEVIVKTGLRATIEGGGGNDTLTGADGDDWLTGGAGSDILEGGDGIDTAIFSGRRADYVRTIGDNGVVTLSDQRENVDAADGLIGIEFFRFADRTLTLAELLNNAPTGLSLADGLILENSKAQASVGTLSVVDDAGPHTYTLLSDAGGRFKLDGNKILYTGQGSLDFEQASSYRIRVKATDRFSESVEKDLVIVVGDVTSERATGTVQADTMWGGAGGDVLNGLGGNDLLKGGGGQDTLTGGQGKDLFVFSNRDTSSLKSKADYITDFSGRSGDRIDLKAMDANTTKRGDQAFSFISKSAFTKGGQMRCETVGKDTYIYLNTDNDKAAEGVIRLKGALDLQKGWFVL